MKAASGYEGNTPEQADAATDPGGTSAFAADSDSAEGEVPDISVLERRYRRLLRLLPEDYRVARAEEMVGTFLESRRAEDPENFDLTQKHGAPSWEERRSVAALSLRQRLANPEAPVAARIRVDALTRAVFAFLTVACALSILALLYRLIAGFWPLTSADQMLSTAQRFQAPQAVGLWPSIIAWVFVVWIPALPLARHGGRTALATAATLAGIATAVDVASVVAGPAPGQFVGAAVFALLHLVVTALLAALATVGAPITATHHRIWLIVAAGATGGLAAIQTAGIIAFRSSEIGQDWMWPMWLRPVGWAIVDEAGLWCWAVITAAVIIRLLPVQQAGARAAQALGLCWFAVAILCIRIATGIPLISATVAAARSDPAHAVDYIAVVTAIGAQALLVAVIAGAALVTARQLAPAAAA